MTLQVKPADQVFSRFRRYGNLLRNWNWWPRMPVSHRLGAVPIQGQIASYKEIDTNNLSNEK